MAVSMSSALAKQRLPIYVRFCFWVSRCSWM